MALRINLDDMEGRRMLPLTGLELRLLRHPASSQSLYQLHYRDVNACCLKDLTALDHYIIYFSI
jgi:hypothetical protein